MGGASDKKFHLKLSEGLNIFYFFYSHPNYPAYGPNTTAELNPMLSTLAHSYERLTLIQLS